MNDVVPRNLRKEQARIAKLALAGKIRLVVNWRRNVIEIQPVKSKDCVQVGQSK